MKKLTTLLSLQFLFIFCYSQSIQLSPGAHVVIYHQQAAQLDAIQLLNSSGQDWNDINDAPCQGTLTYQLSLVSGSSTAMYVNISGNHYFASASTPFTWSGFDYDPRLFYQWTNAQGGVFNLSAIYTCSGTPQTLCSVEITVMDEYPTGNGGTIPQTDYCSFQLVRGSYTGTTPYNAVDDFAYSTTQTVSATAVGSGPFNPEPGAQATVFQYSISPSWSYVYTSTPNKLGIIPPTPTPPGNYGNLASSKTAVLSATGSSGSSCIASNMNMAIQVDYPAHYVDSTYPTPTSWQNIITATQNLIFRNITIAQISSTNNNLDLNGTGVINLQSKVTSDHSELLDVDWYTVDSKGTETLIAEKSSNVSVKVAGLYKAKLNLHKGSTVNPTTFAVENYSANKYYIAESNIVEVYNSSSSTPTVASMSMYPNPACSNLTVNYQLDGKVTSASLLVTDASSGATVIQQPLYINQQTQSMDVSKLTTGNYVVTIVLNGNVNGQSATLTKFCQ